MHPYVRRLLTMLVVSVSLSLAWPPVAVLGQEASGGASGDNTAVAISTKDGSSTFRVSFRIVRTSSDVIDESNIAFAFSSCEGCETVAIAFQVVLVSGSPSTVIPENYAIALNFECTSCETLASAYQFVLGTDGNVHFSPEGSRALAEIRRALQLLRTSDLSIEEIQAQLDLLANDLRTVLEQELVTAGPEGVEVSTVEEPGATTEPTPEPTSTPGTGTSPAPEPSSSPTSLETTTPAESPAATTSPATTEPSPSPSPSPSPIASASP